MNVIYNMEKIMIERRDRLERTKTKSFCGHQLRYIDVHEHLVTWLKQLERQICVSARFGALCDYIP